MRILQTRYSVLLSFLCLCAVASAQDTRAYVFAAPGAIYPFATAGYSLVFRD
jgi:hypothetical protein